MRKLFILTALLFISGCQTMTTYDEVSNLTFWDFSAFTKDNFIITLEVINDKYTTLAMFNYYYLPAGAFEGAKTTTQKMANYSTRSSGYVQPPAGVSVTSKVFTFDKIDTQQIISSFVKKAKTMGGNGIINLHIKTDYIAAFNNDYRVPNKRPYFNISGVIIKTLE